VFLVVRNAWQHEYVTDSVIDAMVVFVFIF
jgi:hypothetical protein